MLSTLFSGVFSSGTETNISILNFIICMAVSLIIGAFLAWASTYKTKASKSFLITMGILPAVVCIVIMMVNGNIGAGIAVAGAFSLVRYRSAPGSGKDIAAIFLAMGAGLISGMGYLAYAVLYAVIMGTVMILCNAFILNKNRNKEKLLCITIPEDLQYTEQFNDVFEQYTTSVENVSVKTTNMGSLFKLKYNITLKPDADEKAMIDALRCHNGNLEIAISNQEAATNEL